MRNKISATILGLLLIVMLAIKILSPSYDNEPVAVSGQEIEPKGFIELNSETRWMLDNAIPGTQWDEQVFAENGGGFEEYKAKGLNFNIIRAYYFPKANTTILVDIPKMKITAESQGRSFN